MFGSMVTIRPLRTAAMLCQPERAFTFSAVSPATSSASTMTSGSFSTTISLPSFGYAVVASAAMFVPPARRMRSSMKVPGPAVKSLGSISKNTRGDGAPAIFSETRAMRARRPVTSVRAASSRPVIFPTRAMRSRTWSRSFGSRTTAGMPRASSWGITSLRWTLVAKTTSGAAAMSFSRSGLM